MPGKDIDVIKSLPHQETVDGCAKPGGINSTKANIGSDSEFARPGGATHTKTRSGPDTPFARPGNAQSGRTRK